MGWATWFLDNTRVIEGYESLKPEYFEIYRTVYTHPIIQNQITASTGEMIDKAITAGSKSTNFDPHGAVNSVNNLYTLIILLFASLSGVLEGLNVVVQLIWIFPHTRFDPVISTIVGAIPGGIPLFLMWYFWIMSKDTELVQQVNKKLKVGPGKIRSANRNPSRVFAYQVWNASLRTKSKIPVMSFLLIIRLVRESWYQGLMGDNKRQFYAILYRGFENIVTQTIIPNRS